MFDRYKLYSSAKQQSRKYAADVARLLKAGKLKEAVDLSSSAGMKSSHLAKVSLAGLQEWQFQGATGETDREAALEAAKRAMQRATAVNLADLKKGLSFLATTGATAPFVGLFGTTFGIINAFSGMALTGSGGIAAISAGIAEALITTALGHRRGLGLQLLLRPGRRLHRRDGQLRFGASRLRQEERLIAAPNAPQSFTIPENRGRTDG
jgi:biopolymer transport protein ExbB/biopolymer transport protein TolQ